MSRGRVGFVRPANVIDPRPKHSACFGAKMVAAEGTAVGREGREKCANGSGAGGRPARSDAAGRTSCANLANGAKRNRGRGEAPRPRLVEEVELAQQLQASPVPPSLFIEVVGADEADMPLAMSSFVYASSFTPDM